MLTEYDIISATWVADQTIFVMFGDGTAGEIDFSSLLRGPLYEELLITGTFQQFIVSSETVTIVWVNGLDVAPEVVRRHITQTP